MAKYTIEITDAERVKVIEGLLKEGVNMSSILWRGVRDFTYRRDREARNSADASAWKSLTPEQKDKIRKEYGIK